MQLATQKLTNTLQKASHSAKSITRKQLSKREQEKKYQESSKRSKEKTANYKKAISFYKYYEKFINKFRFLFINLIEV